MTDFYPQGQDITQKVCNILVMAKAKIKDPKCWTTTITARDSHGDPVMSQSSEAVRWCVLGALMAVTHRGDRDRLMAEMALENAIKNLSGHYSRNIAKFNDEHTHAEIMELFDTAIEELADA